MSEREIARKLFSQLGEEMATALEREVFAFVYRRASELRIELDWNQRVFSELYFIHVFRIRDNIRFGVVEKLLRAGESVMAKTDIELSSINHRFIMKTGTSVEMKFLRDVNCGKCGKFTITMKKMQLRSMDEGFTAVFRCADCGNGWSEN